ncbi:TPA: prepilin peptidase [Proteus mirabilis]
MNLFLSWYMPITFFIIGVCIGSFVNVVIYRYPLIMLQKYNSSFNKISLSYPASHCTVCKNKILKRDNIPVLSWLLRKGRCRYCDTKISINYLITEAFFGFVFLFSVLYLYPSVGILSVIAVLILFSYLYSIFFIDLKFFLIPDVMCYSLLFLGFIFSYFKLIPISIILSLSGAVFAYIIVYVSALIFKMIRNIDGIGFGDYKLFAVGGAWVGFFNIPYLILLSSFIGIIFYLLNKIFRFSSIDNLNYLDDLTSVKDRVIPFGPAICISIYIYILYLFINR